VCSAPGSCATLGGANRCYVTTAGQAGGMCLSGGSCPSGTACSSDNYCLACGDFYEPCCASNVCSSSYTCQTASVPNRCM
jgi:hypothetical protein